jgi:exodeoxyribonuclease VII small subunit
MRKYEELITDLKEIVKKIENNETNLDEMIILYEQGSMLIKECEERLSDAEVKISKLGKE